MQINLEEGKRSLRGIYIFLDIIDLEYGGMIGMMGWPMVDMAKKPFGPQFWSNVKA